MSLTLVILAAGVGRRYGGLKQFEPIGPGGATLIDYAIYDARNAGFDRFVFVIRPETQVAFEAALTERYRGQLAVAFALQRADALPDGFQPPAERSKPWGTGHALLAAEHLVEGPFATINADDFYGPSSFADLAQFLRRMPAGNAPEHALVGYALRDTLSDGGPVSRAICRCTPDGWLESIAEITAIETCGRDGRYVDEQGVIHLLDGDGLVSMNLWGFRPSIFEPLRHAFRAFLQAHARSTSAEFHLPAAIADAIRNGQAGVRVLRSRETWSGVTHPSDRVRVAERIRALVAQGIYPERL